MRFGMNWSTVIPTAVFCFLLWLLQSELSTLYAVVESTCGEVSCGNKIATAYGILSLSTVISAVALAWASYRFNTAIYKGNG